MVSSLTTIGPNGNKNLDTIFLVDSSFDLELLKSEQNFNSKIITFDFNSHKNLLDWKIHHEISDKYVTESELRELQEKTLTLSQWSKQKEIAELISYEGINLGNLTFNNFINFIGGFLKKFYEVLKIVQQHANHEFVCSTEMLEIVKIFSNNVLSVQKQSINKHEETIQHSYGLRKFSFSITLTKEKYLKLKEITEYLLAKIFDFDKTRNEKDNILLVEFDPIKYKTLLLSQNKYLHSFLLFNRRRPAVWNFESFNVIRKSKCSIVVSKKLIDDSLQKQINQLSQSFEKKLQNIWNNDFFTTFFSVDDVSFWNALKTFFEHELKIIMKNSIEEIELAKKLFENYDIKSIVILSEIGPQEQILMHVARKNGTSVILMQHGIPYETKESSIRNNFQGFFPNFSDSMIVWSKSTKKYLESFGIPSSKLQVLGNSPYDDLVVKKNKSHNDVIVLATSPPMKDIVYDNLVETNEKYQAAIESICKTVTKLNQKLVIKLHPSLVDFDIESMIKKFGNTISVIKSGTIFPLIENCKLLLTFDLSTTILEAQIMRKPAVSIIQKNYGFGNSNVLSSGSCICITINDLEETLTKILNDNSYWLQLIEQGSKFANEYLVNQGTATKAIHEFLDSV